MKRLPNEKVVARFTAGEIIVTKIIVTNLRIISQKKWWGKTHIVNVMLEEVSSCEIRFRSHPWLIVFSIALLLAAFLVFTANGHELAQFVEKVARGDWSLFLAWDGRLILSGVLLLAAFILAIIYIITRRATVSQSFQVKFRNHPWLVVLSISSLVTAIMVFMASEDDIANLADLVAQGNWYPFLGSEERIILSGLLLMGSVILATAYLLTRNIIVLLATSGTTIIIDAPGTGLRGAESLVYKIEQAKNRRYLLGYSLIMNSINGAAAQPESKAYSFD